MNLTLKQKIVGVVVAILALFGVGATQFGSVGVSSEYNATTTHRYDGTAIADLQVLKVGAGALGSVVITGANTGIIYLYDSTSTVTNTEWATSTLATFPTNAAVGTYTFDVNFSKGLLIDYVTNVATSTITWR